MRITDLSLCNINLHCYSLRIDAKPDDVKVSYTDDTDFPDVETCSPFFSPTYNWIQHNFTYALVGFETSKAGKDHYQCICFTKTPIGEKAIAKMRHYIKTHLACQTTKQPVSLKKSVSPLGLFQYCQKERNIKHNLPDKLYKEIQALADKYYIKPRREVLIECTRVSHNTLKSLYDNVCEAYRDERLLSMPRKIELWNLGLKYNIIGSHDYFFEFYAPRAT